MNPKMGLLYESQNGAPNPKMGLPYEEILQIIDYKKLGDQIQTRVINAIHSNIV